MKRFVLLVARPTPPQAFEESSTPFDKIIVVRIPWEEFCVEDRAARYAKIVQKAGGLAIIVAAAQDGGWIADGLTQQALWRRLCEITPPESMGWHDMPVEAEFYPWEEKD